MTSFPAAARRVRDEGLTSRERLLALRECVLRFAPYGFRATWHHLIVSADVPRLLDDDPRSLNRAVDELEPARLVWLAQAEQYAERRQREKAAGRRAAGRGDSWRTGTGLIAYCPDFTRHPSEPLVVVMRRLIAAYESGSARCRACGTPPAADTPCPTCGVDRLNRAGMAARTVYRWHEVWQRTAR
jgi:hypothetical protein